MPDTPHSPALERERGGMTIIVTRKRCGEAWQHWSHEWFGNATTVRFYCDGKGRA